MVRFPPPEPSAGAVSFTGGDVKVARLHPFTLSPGEARRLQGELAPRVVPGPSLDLSRVRYVAGADVSTQGERGYATVAVLSFPGLSLVEVRGFEAPLEFPYVPGLLAFREIPLVVGVFSHLISALVVGGPGGILAYTGIGASIILYVAVAWLGLLLFARRERRTNPARPTRMR